MAIEQLSHKVAPAANSALRTVSYAYAPAAVATVSTGTTSATPNSTPSTSGGGSTFAAPIPEFRPAQVLSSRSLARQRTRTTNATVDKELRGFRKEFEAKVKETAIKHKKSESELLGRVLLKNKYGLQKRKTNSFNAFRHAQSQARKESGERLEFLEARVSDAAAYRTASQSELQQAKTQLTAAREEKQGAVYKTAKGRTQHAASVIKNVNQSLKELEKSANVEGICFFVNSSNRDNPLSQVTYTGHTREFLEGPAGHELGTLVSDMRTFAQSGHSGLSGNYANRQTGLKQEISTLFLSNLASVVGPTFTKTQMSYTDYERSICQAYGVKLVGWQKDFGAFRSPSYLGAIPKLQKIVALLKSGALRFEKMSAQEVKALNERLTQDNSDE